MTASFGCGSRTSACTIEGDLAAGLRREALRRARRATAPVQAARLAVGRLVLAQQHPGLCHSVLPGAPGLRRLEHDQFLDVEGASRAECMRIMRHEAGHAFQHAYQLHRRRRWQELFGKSSTRYPEYYRPNPASKKLRPAPATLVCAEPSGRGLRRNVCGLAQVARGLATQVRRLAGTEETRVRRSS